MWIVVVGVGGCDRGDSTSKRGGPAATKSSPQDLVTAAKKSLDRREFLTASRLIQEALVANPNDPTALELAADMAVQGDDTSGSIKFYRLAIDASDDPSKRLWDKLGEQYVNAGRPFESVAVLKSAIARYPDETDLRQKLVGLQAAIGIEWEAAEHLQWLVQRGHGGLNLLIILSDLNRPQTVEATCKFALQHHPEDLRPQYSLARLPAYHSQWNEVAERLRPVIERHPDFVPASALYGRAIVELGDSDAVAAWTQSLPPGIENHPQYWLAAGVWAERQSDWQRAANAFWRAVLLNENDGEALNRLSASLAQLGRTDSSPVVAQRAAKIASVRDHVDSLLSWRNNSQSAAVKIARTLDELGRRWEATSWLQEAYKMTQNEDPNLDQAYKSIRSRLTGETPWQMPELLVAANIDLSDLPGVDWRPRHGEAQVERAIASESEIRFSDQASARTLDHICRIGKPPGEEAGLAIYQSGAGGAGVIDFDLDGWPDIYLTEMDGAPMREDSGPNGFFRNRAGRFEDVTESSNVGDHGFAQGIAVGDYNADGFSDLFVANIGRDRLFRNNGDGTFADVTDTAGLSGKEWTTSAAIADIDGDGNADLFLVGYCGDDKFLELDCVDEKLNEPRSCSPLVFDAQRDRVWRGRGDGTFVEVSQDWLGPHESGRGFGVVVGTLDSDPGLDIYVANDMSANHFWARDTGRSDFGLTEQATVRGLAFNERSVSQASMGIAAGDADGDGDVDFLLTHFSGDYNTYYEQISPGMWADRSNRVGLAGPSDRMLGYGTQWIDADNDGSPELLIANGDIDDFTHKNRKFRQPVQLFDRRSDGRWIELTREKIGDYFGNDRLARAVVTLDADRDGRTDLLVTHLYDPVTLLVNQTPTPSRQIRFFVRGVQSHRDAIGTRITIHSGQRTATGQLFAGDGYQCTNERCITFGLGDANSVDDVTVVWPDGSISTFESLAAGKDYLVIEGSQQAFALTPR